jgi:hypothetical protein
MATHKRSGGTKGGAGHGKGSATHHTRSRAAPAHTAAHTVKATARALHTVGSDRRAEHQGMVGEGTSDGGAAEFSEPSPSWKTSAEEDLRLRTEAATSEFRRRADELRVQEGREPRRLAGSAEPPWGDAVQRLRRASSVAREIALAVARLAAAIATVPLRLAWALLRDLRSSRQS